MIKVAFSDKYIYQLPEGHRFPIEKYELVKEQLVYEGTISEEQIFDPGLVEEQLILAVHDTSYWNRLKNLNLIPKEARKIGLPVNQISVKRARNSVAGTVKASINAFENGIGINLSGGTHHAYKTHGEGFCFLNDLAIAAVNLLEANDKHRILVIDLDVHQGNGTAKIFENDPRVFTFSMHGENNYPLYKEASNLDIALPKGTSDDAYLKILQDQLRKLFIKIDPTFVFYQAGVDVMEGDRLGKLALTKMGVKARDELVIKSCHQKDVPLVITMGGGYHRELRELVDAHCNTFRTAVYHYS